MAIIDFDVAKQHLRIDHEYEDELIRMQIEQASAVVVDYLKMPEGSWDMDSSDAPAPWPVQAAALLVLTTLHEDREGGDPISKAVRDLLIRFRDPALA
jgi:hypothetical protein